jgi:hypothetical protein
MSLGAATPSANIPNHKKPDRGTLKAILRQADLSIHEFEKLL